MTSTELMNVAAFVGVKPAQGFANLNPQDESLSDGIGSSYAVVGYRGKVWSLRYRGETHTFVRPDDGSPAAFLDVIVLRSASYRSKTYYVPGSFTEGSVGQPPLCASIDGVTPDPGVAQKQAEACAICPRNEWKDQPNGRKGRDCADYKRLAVLIVPSQTTPLLGAPLLEPVFLRVPAASLNDLAVLGDAMTQKGFHYSTYVTRIGFVLDKAHPQMTFRALQPLTDQESPRIMEMREDVLAYRITGENEVGKSQGGVARVATGVGASGLLGSASTAPSSGTSALQSIAPTAQPNKPSPVTPAPATILPASGEDEIAKLEAKLAAARAAKTGATATMTVIPPLQQTNGNMVGVLGLGDQQPVVEVAPATPTMGNTVEDTGPAEEADADLDARVAALL
ncbi:MAG: hypothetical protein KGL39_56650 [Patescibacteria group bacterium]|nr:hypothetical protein [Patescibacteria group bacterium]